MHCASVLESLCGSFLFPGAALHARYIAVKNAAFTIVMMKFGTEHTMQPAQSGIDLRGEEHAKRWRKEVDPECGPIACGEGGAKRARRIHAHSRDRGFQKYIDRNQRS